MQINFRYDKTTVINALRLHFLNRGETKVLRILFIALFLLGIWGYWKGIISYPVVVIIFLLIVLLTVVFWFILPHSIYKKAKTFSEPSISLQYGDEGIAIGTHAGARQLSWNSFNRVLETTDFFYLYRNNNAFFLIPTAAFRSETEKKDFRELLHRQFSNYSVK
jgi:hypothetical protein